jgi:hypothetical protein
LDPLPPGRACPNWNTKQIEEFAMNLWSLLGVSVAVLGLFFIGVNELCRSQAFY